jgi:hypothetical protein
MAGGRHLYVGRDDANFTEAGGDLRQRGYAGAIDAVVVGDKDAHMTLSSN